MRIIIIDNYDSFTYNLYHYLCQLAEDVSVKRNDELTLTDIESFTHIVISPGPGLPSQAGICMEVIRKYINSKAILGVCLGCQALAEYSGATLYNQQRVAHGISRTVNKNYAQSWLLNGITGSFKVGLYHSWAVDPQALPSEWQVCGISEDNVLMAMEHTKLPVAGVQFHPESVMTEHGLRILENWLKRST